MHDTVPRSSERTEHIHEQSRRSCCCLFVCWLRPKAAFLGMCAFYSACCSCLLTTSSSYYSRYSNLMWPLIAKVRCCVVCR